jgi:hypothetical protein
VIRGKYIAERLACAALAWAMAVPFPCVAQKGNFHPAQQHPPPRPAPVYHPPPPPQQRRPPAYQPPRPGQAQVRPQPGGHAGDWLRRYKDLPPAEQERALQNDTGFRRLPPAQQQQLRERLQHFSGLPPQQQLRMLNRMETWEHLTPGQKQQARQIFGQIKQLPPDRQRAVGTAIHDLRPMTPEQRERIINSDRFKGMFSDQEREMMRGATRLPLAPAEGSEVGPPE